VQYVGRAEYLKHHPGVGPDREGNPRETIVFELYLEGSRVALPNLRPDPSPTIPASLRKRSLASLRKEAYTSLVPEGMVIGGGHRNTYRRSGIIKAYVLKRANGKCEGCESPAPFTTSKDEPYLEPHHIARRADGGPDHPRWVIALCPNCHARVHRGGDGHDYNIYLAERVALIEDTLEAH
jgi:5-methylcytosine-specific restriction protein A